MQGRQCKEQRSETNWLGRSARTMGGNKKLKKEQQMKGKKYMWHNKSRKRN